MSAKGSPYLVVIALLAGACGSEDPPAGTATEGQASTGTGESTDGPGTSMATSATSAVTGADATTMSVESSGDTGPVTDSGEETAGSTTTEECPAGTEGCPCDGGRTCEAGLVCSGEGVCEPGAACRSLDPDPHADEATATMLGSLGCNSSTDLGLIGTLDGPETDWYRYFGNEGVVLCAEQPEATVAAAIEVEVCAYIECLEGTASAVVCAGGSSSATSPEGRPGCCGSGQTRIDDYECGGFLSPKNVDVWISVASTEEACEDYALSYAF